jgi:hypothetical protein
MRNVDFLKLTWKPVLAGILDIISGAIGMVGGLYIVILSSIFRAIHQNLGVSQEVIMKIEQFISSVSAVPFVLMFIGIAAIIGGVYALQRRIWAFALAGSILSCMVFPIFGLPAIIITVIARDEFS